MQDSINPHSSEEWDELLDEIELLCAQIIQDFLRKIARGDVVMPDIYYFPFPVLTPIFSRSALTLALPAACNHVPIPSTAVFENAPLCWIVHVDETETRRISKRPLKVVHK